MQTLLVHLQLEPVDAFGEPAQPLADGGILRAQRGELARQRAASLLGQLELDTRLRDRTVDRVEHRRQRRGDLGGQLPLRTADDRAPGGFLGRDAFALALADELVHA